MPPVFTFSLKALVTMNANVKRLLQRSAVIVACAAVYGVVGTTMGKEEGPSGKVLWTVRAVVEFLGMNSTLVSLVVPLYIRLVLTGGALVRRLRPMHLRLVNPHGLSLSKLPFTLVTSFFLKRTNLLTCPIMLSHMSLQLMLQGKGLGASRALMGLLTGRRVDQGYVTGEM